MNKTKDVNKIFVDILLKNPTEEFILQVNNQTYFIRILWNFRRKYSQKY